MSGDFETIFPEPTRAGDQVRVVSTSGPVEEANLLAGIETLAGRFDVQVGRGALKRAGYLAGEDAQRLVDLQFALDSTTCAAVFASRGGFGVTRILDDLDFGGFLERPKWVVGSSDLTALLVHLWSEFQVASIHGPMVARFGELVDDAGELFGLVAGQRWREQPLTGVANGEVTCPMVGGNLTIMAHMAGALSPDFAKGCILFLEDVGEAPYRIDRHLTQLDRSGSLDGIRGVVIGDFTNCGRGKDGVSVEEALKGHLAGLGVPVAAGYPAAHGDRNRPFIHGGVYTLNVDGADASLVCSP